MLINMPHEEYNFQYIDEFYLPFTYFFHFVSAIVFQHWLSEVNIVHPIFQRYDTIRLLTLLPLNPTSGTASLRTQHHHHLRPSD